MTPAEIAAILRTLANAPRYIAEISAPYNNQQLAAKPDKQNWSAVEVLAHLRACADVWGETIARMLAEDEPTLRYIHPNQYLLQIDYPNLPFGESLPAFAKQRTELLAELSDLSGDMWERSGIIAERRHTVFSQARRMALHEENHCRQLAQLLTPEE